MDYSIGDKLKRLRKINNITQEQLAEKLEISRSKISSWETNKRDMSITEAIKLANIYDISLDNVFGLDNISEKSKFEIKFDFVNIKYIEISKPTL